jgi:signal transduction histidine kinase
MAKMQIAQSWRTRDSSSLAFFAFLMLYVLVTMLALLAGIGAAVAGQSASLHDTLHEIGLGEGFFARVGQGMADASHRTEPPLQLALDYVFSLFNIGLAAFLLWLRRRDPTARLLAVGMIGTAAVFNLQAEAVYQAAPRTTFDISLYSGFRLIAGVAYLLALLLFPEGKLVPRWPKWAKTALYAPIVLAATLLAFRPQEIQEASGTVPLILFFGLFTPIAAVMAQAYRVRRSPTSEERQQARLLFWALIPALLVGLFVLTGGIGPLLDPGFEGRPLQELPVFVFRVFQPVFALIPIALFIGLVRYRLWNIDRVISRTLVYGSMVVFISAVYIGVVVGVGRVVGATGNNPILSLAATAIVAIAFEPAKSRLQRVANRVVFGKRATPYEVLSEFSERMPETYGTEELLSRGARILAEGTGASRTEVWLRVGSELRPAATWPPDRESPPDSKHVSGEELPAFEAAATAVPVRHHGELLGAFTVVKPPNESLTLTEHKLVLDLASQAGLVLRNVRLTAELMQRLEDLRASRQRLVTAQDEERRRLERDIHDGAQQQLVALSVNLGLAQRMAKLEAPKLAELLSQMKTQSNEAVETLRDLARGIYPPVLASDGLPAALQAHCRRVPLPVEVTTDDVGRHPQEVEAAVYFCCLEALQNVTKSANASRAVVRLERRDGLLRFTVQDDGQGFDPSRTRRGSGLQNMADRVEALGGSFQVISAPGMGTTVSGEIPLRPAQ